MALLAKDLILSTGKSNLKKLLSEGYNIKNNLIDLPKNNYICAWRVPKPLLELTGLYLLNFIKESNSLTGGRTSTIRLKDISYVSTNLCNKIAHSLKKHYANCVAKRYQTLLVQ